MNKLPEKVVMALYKIDLKIKELNEKKKELTRKAFDKFGESTGVVTVKGEKPYLRVKIIDSGPNFMEGETLFRSAGINRFNADISCLKHPPKS